ncbi:hypothetical protein [Chryseolinea sp. H1M3-3]|uniref:hypothetical protein n=1 Tax=Chryseolinea sp. H1M3-3 TaxID=3034144 RepID=UPI0023EB4883|nr:hypothetical protein [Chryseolinea sp. H1M3-3]
MKKLAIETRKDCEPNLRAIQVIPRLLQSVIDSMQAFDHDNGLTSFEFKATVRPLEYILKMQQLVPNRERQRGQDWKASRISDTKLLQIQTKERLYELHKGKIAGLHVTLEKFKENVEVPIESARSLINAVADLDNELLKLPKDQYFSQFISIDGNGRVIVAPDAEEKIGNHFTLYAGTAQETFYNDVSTLLSKLSETENKFNVRGLISKAIDQNGEGYFFRCENLKSIK